jgi:uncharacterized membrane protein YfcA
MAGGRVLKLAVIATAAGAFSAMFGVGGGTVIVPLLIVWFAYGEREATGTSLLAIVGIGAFATIGQGLHGNVSVIKGILIGIPAVAGVVAGTEFQQRLSERAISLLFAILLLVVAAQLVIG